MKSKLITFSGIDSAGKSTYISLLTNELDRRNIKHKVVWSRGGYTKGFEFLKKLMRTISGKKLPAPGKSTKRDEMLQKGYIREIWYLVAIIDLIWLYAVVFRFYKIIGYTVICDRYIWDTYVDFSFIYSEKLNSTLWKALVKCHSVPDLSMYFYVSPEESLRRSELKKEPFSEPISKRIERIQRYSALRDEGKWNYRYNTENFSIDETWEKIANVLPY